MTNTYPSTFSKHVHHWLLFPVYFLMFSVFFYHSVWHPAHCSLVSCAAAQETPKKPVETPKPTKPKKLTFGAKLANRMFHIVLPMPSESPKGSWKLVGGSEHQNHVLSLIQARLVSQGVTDSKALRYGAAILLAENEPMDPVRIGDQGHAFGICQRNLGRVYAKDFLAKNPEWKTIETQVNYCADRFAAAWKKYGNVFQATVQHNSPLAASKKRDACHISPCYFQRVERGANRLTL